VRCPGTIVLASFQELLFWHCSACSICNSVLHFRATCMHAFAGNTLLWFGWRDFTGSVKARATGKACGFAQKFNRCASKSSA
jgi:hypothetical protein